MKFLRLISLLIILLLLSGCSNSNVTTLFAMDTYVSITVNGDSTIAEQIETEIKQLEKLFSVTDESSEISILNKYGKAEISEDTKTIIERATEISTLTNGAFDITVYPIVKLWGFTTDSHKVPLKNQIQDSLKSVDYRKLKIDNNTAYIENGECDLGGIAKGYTGAKIRKILKSSKVESAVISIGGNVILHGFKENGKEWNVGIQHPIESDNLIGTVQAHDVSVVTSGGYQRYFEEDNKIYHHIIDPKTGYPADNGIISVTVITDDDTLADALATSLYVLGKEKSEELWRNQKNFEMILVTETDVYISEGLENKFSLNDNNFKLNIIT